MGRLQFKETDQMQAYDNSNSSDNKIPRPADDAKQASDKGSNGSKNSKRERKTEDKHEGIEKCLAAVSF